MELIIHKEPDDLPQCFMSDYMWCSRLDQVTYWCTSGNIFRTLEYEIKKKKLIVQNVYLANTYCSKCSCSRVLCSSGATK